MYNLIAQIYHWFYFVLKAEGLVNSLRELFESVYLQKKKEAEEAKPEPVTEAVPKSKEDVKPEENKEVPYLHIDLVGAALK